MRHFGQLRYTEGNGCFVCLLNTRLLDCCWYEKGKRPTKKYIVVIGKSEDAKYINSVEDFDKDTEKELLDAIKVSDPTLFNNEVIKKGEEKEVKKKQEFKSKDIFRAKGNSIKEYDTFQEADKGYITDCLKSCKKTRILWTINNFINGNSDSEEAE